MNFIDDDYFLYYECVLLLMLYFIAIGLSIAIMWVFNDKATCDNGNTLNIPVLVNVVPQLGMKINLPK